MKETYVSWLATSVVPKTRMARGSLWQGGRRFSPGRKRSRVLYHHAFTIPLTTRRAIHQAPMNEHGRTRDGNFIYATVTRPRGSRVVCRTERRRKTPGPGAPLLLDRAYHRVERRWRGEKEKDLLAAEENERIREIYCGLKKTKKKKKRENGKRWDLSYSRIEFLSPVSSVPETNGTMLLTLQKF